VIVFVDNYMCDMIFSDVTSVEFVELIFMVAHCNKLLINLPTIGLDILNFIVGAERAENRVKRNGVVSGSCRKTTEQSADQKIAERERNGGYRNRLEHGAANSPLTYSVHDAFCR